MKLLSLTVSLLALTACSTYKNTPALPQLSLKEAVEGPLRTPENMKRDIYRHPLETLTFFEIEPHMSVVEIAPSGGWYTEILAPFLAAKGTYIISEAPADPNGYTKARVEWMKNNPQIAAGTRITAFQPPLMIEVAEENSVDRVLTFRNVHNWPGDEGKQAAFNGFFKALKPGGILGVVEHRASTKTKYDPKSGYMLEADVIKFAEKSGFKLLGKSEVNANPKDTTNYPDGVWTLPPRLRLGDKDKAKYLAIGESDRMTLKFVKPISKQR